MKKMSARNKDQMDNARSAYKYNFKVGNKILYTGATNDPDRREQEHQQEQTVRDTMRKEYRFDYRRAKPNRFAEKMSKGVVAVILEPDVAAVFGSSKAVNTLLRSVIAALPGSER